MLDFNGSAMRAMSRRDFFRAGGAALAALAVPSVLTGCAGVFGGSSDFTPDYTLNVAFSTLNLGGRRVKLRTYNGQIPGPTLVAAPGDTFNIRVQNNLPPNKPLPLSGGTTGGMGMSSRDHEFGESPIMQNTPHDFNTTNLHVHGLQVATHLFRPFGTNDPTAPMLGIDPGDSYDYPFTIPTDQPCGMYFYHPHYHGSTLLQVVNGMVGVIIVPGPIDQVPEIAAARDLHVAITDLGLFPSMDDPTLWVNDPNPGTYFNSQTNQPLDGYGLGSYILHTYLVNGQSVFEVDASDPNQVQNRQLPIPDINIQPGEVVRLRILNGTSDTFMPIAIEGHTVYVLAYDGVNLLEPLAIPYAAGQAQVELAPANRVELLIRGSEAEGTFRLMQLANSEQFAPVPAKDLARISVVGSPVTMGIPATLPTPVREYPLPDHSEVSGTNNVLFSVIFPYPELPTGVGFTLNSQIYDEFRIDHVAQLGSVEEWTLLNNSTEGHPFHVHVNSFELVSINGVQQPRGILKDVQWVRPNQPVVIRMKFRQWTGKTVFHCHILPHEDTGMMGNMLIQ